MLTTTRTRRPSARISGGAGIRAIHALVVADPVTGLSEWGTGYAPNCAQPIGA